MMMHLKSLKTYQIAGMRRWVSVISEQSPNPEATVFWMDKGADVLGKGAKSLNFPDRYTCSDSPLAGALFKV